MTRRWVLAGLLALFAVPAHAQGTVALLPAPVVKGAPANGRVVTEALRSALEARGFRLVAPGRVNSALGAYKSNPKLPIPIGTLAKIRQATGADYVVYPRVLSVGTGLASQELQATVIVNVVGKSSASFFHTRQVAQTFEGRAAPDTAVIDRTSAEAAASKLLEGFFAKAR